MSAEIGPVQSVRVLGVRVDDVTYDQSVGLIEAWIRERGAHYVVTPNPELVMRAQRDRSFQNILEGAALAVPDGIGLLLAARLLGQPLREHVRGTDLVQLLAARAAEQGWRIFLLGAAEGVASEAARCLLSRHPALKIAGVYSGSPLPESDLLVQRVIRSCGGVDLILVAFGAPAQETWLARNLAPLDIPVGIGVGGVLNFVAGRVPRAPRWVRKLELEFLYRLYVEPWRWRRQLALPAFAMLALAEAVQRQIARRSKRRV